MILAVTRPLISNLSSSAQDPWTVVRVGMAKRLTTRVVSNWHATAVVTAVWPLANVTTQDKVCNLDELDLIYEVFIFYTLVQLLQLLYN